MQEKLMDKLQQHVQQTTDLKAGIALILTGVSGSLAQAITEWANIFVAVGNSALVICGCFLMYFKIKDKLANRRNRRADDK